MRPGMSFFPVKWVYTWVNTRKNESGLIVLEVETLNRCFESVCDESGRFFVSGYNVCNMEPLKRLRAHCRQTQFETSFPSRARTRVPVSKHV